MTHSMNATLALTVKEFFLHPMYVIAALIAVAALVWFVKFLVYDLPKKHREKVLLSGGTHGKRKTRASSKDPAATEEGARIAAAIAASIVAMEDAATVAAITAAVRMYLEAEQAEKTLPSGFRVVSFRRRGGRWNR